MAANLPPQFFQLQKKLKETEDSQEKISILEELLRIVPKHKGTERVQEDLKRKLAKAKKEEARKPKPKQLFFLKKEGAAQVVIIGPPNSGKSSLLNALTGTNVKVGAYPFTTQMPQPGMMPYENILIQLVDTPPLTESFLPGWQKDIIKNADLILILLDLTSENLLKDFIFFEKKLLELNLSEKKVIWVGNKNDLAILNNFSPQLKEKESFISISVSKKRGLEALKNKIFEKLEIVRVYTKAPNKEPNLATPFIIKKGNKLSDLAKEIHEDLLKNFKFAKLFKKNEKKPKIVGRDYLLEDGDIVEIRV